jgi:hypothetical protein
VQNNDTFMTYTLYNSDALEGMEKDSPIKEICGTASICRGSNGFDGNTTEYS